MVVVNATLAAGAIGTLARVLVDNRWTWRNQYPIWSWLAQDYAAAAGAFVAWWVATNALNNLGLEYVIACIAGVGASVAWSFATRTAARSPAAALAEPDSALLGFVDASPAHAKADAAYALDSPPEPAH